MIRDTIRQYMRGKTSPSIHDMQCFVGMIETGEATYDDFQAIGGDVLAAAVAKTKQNIDDARASDDGLR